MTNTPKHTEGTWSIKDLTETLHTHDDKNNVLVIVDVADDHYRKFIGDNDSINLIAAPTELIEALGGVNNFNIRDALFQELIKPLVQKALAKARGE